MPPQRNPRFADDTEIAPPLGQNRPVYGDHAVRCFFHAVDRTTGVTYRAPFRCREFIILTNGAYPV
jgi:hypothetical protein